MLGRLGPAIVVSDQSTKIKSELLSGSEVDRIETLVRSRQERASSGTFLLSRQIQETVTLISHPDARLRQCDIPVACHLGVGELHPMVGDDYKGRVLPHAGPLDGLQEATYPGIGVAHRCCRDVRVRATFVESCVSQGEVHPGERRHLPGPSAVIAAPDPAELVDCGVVDQ